MEIPRNIVTKESHAECSNSGRHLVKLKKLPSGHNQVLFRFPLNSSHEHARKKEVGKGNGGCVVQVTAKFWLVQWDPTTRQRNVVVVVLV